MRLFGLIGFPLGHSFSAGYFTEKFRSEGIANCEFRNFPIENIGMLPDMLATHPELGGFTVTIPYKQQVMAYLDGLSDEAAAIGAVNCVKITPQGLVGYNTDAYGFRESLSGLLGDRRPSALVLGSGGASKAVEYVLRQMGIDYLVVSRRAGDGRISYGDIDKALLESHPLIINASPVGTLPNVDEAPALPYELLDGDNLLFDLVYNPPVTKFLALGAERGAKGVNGHQMLIAQADKAWSIWME